VIKCFFLVLHNLGLNDFWVVLDCIFYIFIYLLLYVGDVSKLMDKTCLCCVNRTELLKDFGQLNANVMKVVQLEFSWTHFFPLWLEPHASSILRFSFFLCFWIRINLPYGNSIVSSVMFSFSPEVDLHKRTVIYKYIKYSLTQLSI